MSEDHEIRHADPREGFDAAEPKVNAIVAFGIGSVLLLILMILAVQAYFNKIWNEAVYEKILAPPSQQLIQLHQREDWNLTHFGYFDKKSGTVRIPVSQAMESFAQEAAGAESCFYPAGRRPRPRRRGKPATPPAGAPAPGSHSSGSSR